MTKSMGMTDETDISSDKLTGFKALIADSVSNLDNLVGYGGNKAVFRVDGQEDLLVGVSYYGNGPQKRARFEHLLDNHEQRELAPRNKVKPTEAFFDALKRSTHLTPPQHLYTSHGMGQEVAHFTDKNFRSTGLMLIRHELGETLLKVENDKVAKELGITSDEALEGYRAIKKKDMEIDRTARAEIEAALTEDGVTDREQINAAKNHAAKAALLKHYAQKREQNPDDKTANARSKAHTEMIENIFIPNLKSAYEQLMTYAWTTTPDALDLKPDNVLWDDGTKLINFIDQGTPGWNREKSQRTHSATQCLNAIDRMLDEYCYDIAPELRDTFEAKRATIRAEYEQEIHAEWPNLRGSAKTLSSHEDVRSIELNQPSNNTETRVSKEPEPVLAGVRQWLGIIAEGIEKHAGSARS